MHVNEHPKGHAYAIVFGAVENPVKAFSQMPVTGSGFLSPRFASIRSGDPALRLNSPGWLKLRPQMVSEFASHDDRIGWCEDLLTSHTPLFARPIQAFVKNYIAFIRRHVEACREEFDRKLFEAGLDGATGILNYKDWTFSAFAPLPNAYIALPTRDNAFVHVDCAFWTGEVLLIILFEGLTMPRPSQTIALTELQAAGADIRIVRAPPTSAGDLSIFSGDLYTQLSGFAEHCALPFGLFRLPVFSRPDQNERWD